MGKQFQPKKLTAQNLGMLVIITISVVEVLTRQTVREEPKLEELCHRLHEPYALSEEREGYSV